MLTEAQNVVRPTTASPSYYRARYYDPGAGRFQQEDPARFSGGTNFYSYTGNSPTNGTDPLGMYTQGEHFSMTLGLASAAFGPKCQEKALAVAQADAAVDDNHGLGGWFQLFTFRGQAWAQPGPHFPTPGMVQSGLSSAVSGCSLKALGEGLHSLQDRYAHTGTTPVKHFLNPLWDVGINVGSLFWVNPLDEAAGWDTAYWLVKFRQECLKCCEQ